MQRSDCEREGDRTVTVSIYGGRCPGCRRDQDEYYVMHCSGCGWMELCCNRCCSPQAEAALNQRWTSPAE